MPIGDLLAQIKGEQPKHGTAIAEQLPSSGSKRPAENGAEGRVVKVVKTRAGPVGPAPPSMILSQRSSQLSANSRPLDRNDKRSLESPVSERRSSATPSLKPVGSASATGSGATAAVRKDGGSSKDRSNPPTAKPTTTASAPKKRSYAEIMQRATMLHSKMGPIGKIQHKSIKETAPSADGRESLNGGSSAAARRPGTNKAWKLKTRGEGHGVAPADDSHHGASSGHAGRGSRAAGSKGKSVKNVARGEDEGDRKTSSKRLTPEPPKKISKAALATTGYKGTARPRPNAEKKPGSGSQPSSSTGAQRHSGAGSRYGGLLSARRSRNTEEEDDDMDDFIEYDDEEPQEGYGRARGSSRDSEEDESDMEAGFSDMEGEDHRASVIARREDQEQEVLERKLKKEKEERRRKMLESRR